MTILVAPLPLPTDHVGIWGAMVCHWARETGAEPRFLSPTLAQAFLRTERPPLTPDLQGDIPCFRLLLPKGTLFSEEGPEIPSVVVADVRAMAAWLPNNVELAGGGLACVGLGEADRQPLAAVVDPQGVAVADGEHGGRLGGQGEQKQEGGEPPRRWVLLSHLF